MSTPPNSDLAPNGGSSASTTPSDEPMAGGEPQDIAQRRLMELVRRLGGNGSDGEALEEADDRLEVVQPVDIDAIARLRLVDRIAALDRTQIAEDDAPSADPSGPAVTDAGSALDLSALRTALHAAVAPLPLAAIAVPLPVAPLAPTATSGIGTPIAPPQAHDAPDDQTLDTKADAGADAGALEPPALPPAAIEPIAPGEAAPAPTAETRLAELVRQQRSLLDRIASVEPEMVAEPASQSAMMPEPEPAPMNLAALLKPQIDETAALPLAPSLIEALAVRTPSLAPHGPLVPPPLRLPSKPTPAIDALAPKSLSASLSTHLEPATQPAAAERGPIIIERAKAEMSAKALAPLGEHVSHPSGLPGLLAGLALSLAIAVVVYGSI